MSVMFVGITVNNEALAAAVDELGVVLDRPCRLPLGVGHDANAVEGVRTTRAPRYPITQNPEPRSRWTLPQKGQPMGRDAGKLPARMIGQSSDKPIMLEAGGEDAQLRLGSGRVALSSWYRDPFLGHWPLVFG